MQIAITHSLAAQRYMQDSYANVYPHQLQPLALLPLTIFELVRVRRCRVFRLFHFVNLRLTFFPSRSTVKRANERAFFIYYYLLYGCDITTRGSWATLF